ncbi:MAG: dihydroorotate dehydrogenase 2 [Gemmataceae bacterium]
MLRYHFLWPFIKRLPPEFAHAAGLNVLRLPFRVAAAPDDPLTWGPLTFRNRIGIAAGFDKNAVCLGGVERLGAGFVEVGTVLVAPWAGNQVRPRMARLVDVRGVWNRLGFTSRGLDAVVRNLARVPPAKRRGLIVAGNIGPHPGNLKRAASRAPAMTSARDELLHLIQALQPHVDLFVVNLSSPNTPGLRSLLQAAELADTVVKPLREGTPAPLLVKLPPEDEIRNPWSEASLNAVVAPLLRVCDGFVAVNTSTRLAIQHVKVKEPELPGGVSGEPLRPEALRVVGLLRSMIGNEKLLIGCGGVMEPDHARQFRDAGADLVELYSGMIYAGPALVARAAAACLKPH